MNSKKLKNIKKIHENNKYYVEILRLTNDYGCKVYYPDSVIYEEKNIQQESIYKINNNFLQIENYKNGYKFFTDLKELPLYAIRLYIIIDVILGANYQNISPELIFPYIMDENNHLKRIKFFDLLKKPDLKENIEKEKKLAKLMVRILREEDCTSIAEDYDIIEGYTNLVDLMQIGGSFK